MLAPSVSPVIPPKFFSKKTFKVKTSKNTNAKSKKLIKKLIFARQHALSTIKKAKILAKIR